MKFTYDASTVEGKMLHGTVEAVTVREAVRLLRGHGLLTTAIRPIVLRSARGTRFALFHRRASLLQVALLARHLALLLRAGITIDRAFDILVRQETRRHLARALRGVLEAVRRGEALASGLRRYPEVFPQRFVAMVEWGEAGGRLPESLEHLATQLEHDREIQARVRGALVYPFIVVGAIILIGGVLTIFTLPTLVSVIEEFNVPLPLTTVVFLAVSRFLVRATPFLLPGGVILLFLLMPLLRSTRVRPLTHGLLLRLPLFGSIVRMVNLARMDRALGSLIQSGIPILETLVIVEGVVGNVWYQRALQSATEDVRTGVSLGKSLGKHPTLFPPIAVDMITIGEETGKLDEVLLYLAGFYEGITEHRTKNLAQAIEPVLLLLVGVVVGVVVLAVISPIYTVTEAIV